MKAQSREYTLVLTDLYTCGKSIATYECSQPGKKSLKDNKDSFTNRGTTL